MNINLKKRLAAAFVFTLIFVSFLLATFFIIKHVKCNCPARGCSICVKVQHTFENLLKHLSFAPISISAIFALYTFVLYKLKPAGFLMCSPSLVELSVRMDN